jgi:hypothetical protein
MYTGFIIVLILILIYSRQVVIYDQMINGFYEADSSFCEESGLDVFSLFLDNDVNNGSRASYILMVKDDNFVINEPINVKLSMDFFNWNNWFIDPIKEKCFTIEFDQCDSFDELSDVFPRVQTLKFYPMLGKIVMFNNSTITAILYKNGINSE